MNTVELHNALVIAAETLGEEDCCTVADALIDEFHVVTEDEDSGDVDVDLVQLAKLEQVMPAGGRELLRNFVSGMLATNGHGTPQ